MPPERPAFRAAGFALLRASALPRVAAGCTRVEVAMDVPAKAADYLRRIARDPVVREAVAVSSLTLGRDLGTLVAGGAEQARVASRRAVLATTSYLLRMTTRSTPFGLLAGVAPVWFDASAQIRLGTATPQGRPPRRRLAAFSGHAPGTGSRPAARPAGHGQQPRGRAQRSLGAGQPAARVRTTTPVRRGGVPEEVSVRAGAPVRRVMAACRTPRVVGDLVGELVDAFPLGGEGNRRNA